MSELLDRARALGAPQDFLDELMDHAQPRDALLEMLLERTQEKADGELGELVGSLRKDAEALSKAAKQPKKNDKRHVRPLATLQTMIELSTARADVASELSSLHATDIAAQLIHDAFEAPQGGTVPAVNLAMLPPSVMLLATLAAHQDCHAWFTGSGAVAAIVAALNLETDVEEEAELMPLACSALANLAVPPPRADDLPEAAAAEGSTAVAKEIFAAGGLVPLIELVQGTRSSPFPEQWVPLSRLRFAIFAVFRSCCAHICLFPAHFLLISARFHRSLRSQQWAAAALCNFSQHGERARQILIKRGALAAIAAGVTRLTEQAKNADQVIGARFLEANPEYAAAAAGQNPEPEPEPEQAVGSDLALEDEAPPSPAKRVVASAGAVIELLLGCLANLAPHNPVRFFPLFSVIFNRKCLSPCILIRNEGNTGRRRCLRRARYNRP